VIGTASALPGCLFGVTRQAFWFAPT